MSESLDAWKKRLTLLSGKLEALNQQQQQQNIHEKHKFKGTPNLKGRTRNTPTYQCYKPLGRCSSQAHINGTVYCMHDKPTCI